MFKVFVLIKRKKGMSRQDFIEYYESKHAPLGASKVPNLKKYVRHYLTPYSNDVYRAEEELPFDVVTEICFDDEKEFEKGMRYLTAAGTAEIISEDEKHLFDQGSIRFTVVKDCKTPLG